MRYNISQIIVTVAIETLIQDNKYKYDKIG